MIGPQTTILPLQNGVDTRRAARGAVRRSAGPRRRHLHRDGASRARRHRADRHAPPHRLWRSVRHAAAPDRSRPRHPARRWRAPTSRPKRSRTAACRSGRSSSFSCRSPASPARRGCRSVRCGPIRRSASGSSTAAARSSGSRAPRAFRWPTDIVERISGYVGGIPGDDAVVAADRSVAGQADRGRGAAGIRRPAGRPRWRAGADYVDAVCGAEAVGGRGTPIRVSSASKSGRPRSAASAGSTARNTMLPCWPSTSAVEVLHRLVSRAEARQHGRIVVVNHRLDRRPRRDRAPPGAPASTPSARRSSRRCKQRLAVDRHAEARVADRGARGLLESARAARTPPSSRCAARRRSGRGADRAIAGARRSLLRSRPAKYSAQPTLMLTSGDSGSRSRPVRASAIDSSCRPAVARKIEIERAHARELRVECDRSTELLFRVVPVLPVEEAAERQRSVRVRKLGIEGNRSFGRGLRAREAFLRRDQPVVRHAADRVAETGVGRRVRRDRARSHARSARARAGSLQATTR